MPALPCHNGRTRSVARLERSTSDKTGADLRWLDLATLALAALALIGALAYGLLASLLSGLLVYELVHLLTPTLSRFVARRTGKIIAVSLLASLVILVTGLAILKLVAPALGWR